MTSPVTAETTLTDWLLRQVAEDERAAKEAAEYEGDDWSVDQRDATIVRGRGGSRVVGDEGYEQSATHIARWDPARVLAECESKRMIVAEHPGTEACACCDYLAPCPTLRLLALPYAGRPGYQETWQP
jgi:hypothetical protein